MENKYSLIGVDGNAFAVMGYVMNAMKECGRDKAERDAYREEAMSGDYNNLLTTSQNMLDILNSGL